MTAWTSASNRSCPKSSVMNRRCSPALRWLPIGNEGAWQARASDGVSLRGVCVGGVLGSVAGPASNAGKFGVAADGGGGRGMAGLSREDGGNARKLSSSLAETGGVATAGLAAWAASDDAPTARSCGFSALLRCGFGGSTVHKKSRAFSSNSGGEGSSIKVQASSSYRHHCCRFPRRT